jgi:hydroxymethylpyrimidine pyrophosphatase-like HAD family hydrolase
MPLDARRDIAVVLTDIDDTLTEHGRLPAKAYAALERLKHAGLIVAPITGRPAGWCDLIARQWPIDGVVSENSARARCANPGHPSRSSPPRWQARYFAAWSARHETYDACPVKMIG